MLSVLICPMNSCTATVWILPVDPTISNCSSLSSSLQISMDIWEPALGSRAPRHFPDAGLRRLRECYKQAEITIRWITALLQGHPAYKVADVHLMAHCIIMNIHCKVISLCNDTPWDLCTYNIPVPSISTAMNPSCYDTPSWYPCTYQSLPFPLLWTHHVMTRHQDTPVRTSPFHFHCYEPIMLWHAIRIPLYVPVPSISTAMNPSCYDTP